MFDIFRPASSFNGGLPLEKSRVQDSLPTPYSLKRFDNKSHYVPPSVLQLSFFTMTFSGGNLSHYSSRIQIWPRGSPIANLYFNLIRILALLFTAQSVLKMARHNSLNLPTFLADPNFYGICLLKSLATTISFFSSHSHISRFATSNIQLWAAIWFRKIAVFLEKILENHSS